MVITIIKIAESEGMNSYRHVPCHEEEREVAVQRASRANVLTVKVKSKQKRRLNRMTVTTLAASGMLDC